MNTDDDSLIPKKVFAKALSVDPRTITRWVKTGKLENVPLGKLARFRKSDLQRIISEGLK